MADANVGLGLLPDSPARGRFWLQGLAPRVLLDAVLDGSFDQVFLVDPDGTILAANGSATRSGTETPIRRSVFDGLPDEEREHVRRVLVSSVGHQRVEEYETHASDGKGVVHFYRCALHPVVDHGGTIVLVLVSRDITDVRRRRDAEEEVKKLNEQIMQRVLELSDANKELESFSYTVSHDLRTPLTIIENYAHVLLLRYADVLDEHGQKNLRGLEKAVDRMSRLITDILKVSRIGREPLRRTRVDLTAMAWSLVHELREREPGREVEVLVQPSLVANADPQVIRVALANLLSNAWKFTSKTPSARIEFGSRDEADRAVYFVKDNGRGFDPRDAQRLFTLFSRLEPDPAFPGTGIGLATVERAIRRHDGRVWAEGQPGRGATFYFTFADNAASPPPRGNLG